MRCTRAYAPGRAIPSSLPLLAAGTTLAAAARRAVFRPGVRQSTAFVKQVAAHPQRPDWRAAALGRELINAPGERPTRVRFAPKTTDNRFGTACRKGPIVLQNVF